METTSEFVKYPVFFTGADGFVSSHLPERLVEFDADVHVFVQATWSGVQTVEGILDPTEQYNSSDPVDVGSGEEISIRELVEMIVEETGFEDIIGRDTSKPGGQPWVKLDTSRAKPRFDWEAAIKPWKGTRDY